MSTEPTMVERAAQGIYESRWTRHGERPPSPWRSPDSTCDWDALVADARAAIATMRVPTRAMMRAATECAGYGMSFEEQWPAVIDAALAPAPEGTG